MNAARLPRATAGLNVAQLPQATAGVNVAQLSQATAGLNVAQPPQAAAGLNVAQLLQTATGLSVAPALAARALKARMAALGLRRPEDYLAQLAGAELQALIELVVVPESWMFRDPEAFGAAAAFVRRRLAAWPGRQQRLLSIPCAGGEEPYSLAMALQDAGVAAGAYSIDALDLSAAAIARAVAGRYTRNAFRGNELGFRERHFTREGDDYVIAAALRRQVSFRQGNLLAFDVSDGAGRYDVIFCRNLLIYFDEPTAAAAIAKLSTLLADDGLLFAGYAEVPAFCQHDFAPLRAPGAFALQKQPAPAAKTGDRPPFRPPSPMKAAQTAAPPGGQHQLATPLRENGGLSPVSAKTGDRPPFRHPVPMKTAQTGAPPDGQHRLAKPLRGNGGLSPVLAVAAGGGAAPPGPPRDAAPLLAQARQQADAGDYRAAAASCHAALAACPDSAEAYFILGMVSECDHKPGVADDCWRRCIYLQPDHYDALCHLALLSEQLGKAAQARAFKRRAARVYQRRQAEPGSTR